MSSVPESTVLGEWAGEGLQHTLTEYLRKRSERAVEALGAEGRSHRAAVEGLEGLVKGLSLYDPRMWALSETMGAMGDKEVFAPKKLQQAVLSRVAAPHEPPAPPLDVLLNELVAAGVHDLRYYLNAKVTEAQLERDEAVAEADTLRGKAEEAAAAAEELATLREEVSRLTGELAEERASIDYLRQHLKDGEGAGSQPTAEASGPKATKPKADKRRNSLWKETGQEDHRGIYYRETPEGTVWEVGWTEDGKQRWHTVDGDLGLAVQERSERVAKANEAKAVAA